MPYKIKIYDIDSNCIFTADNIYNLNYRWALYNSSFESVSNGIYYFMVEDANGSKATNGKIAVIR